MFKQLKKRLLILNMTIITVFMIVTFAVIYISTKENTDKLNEEKLQDAGSFQVFEVPIESLDGEDLENGGGVELVQAHPSAGYYVFFQTLFDEDGVIKDYFANVEVKESIFEEATKKALQQGKMSGKVEIDGKPWKYSRVVVEVSNIDKNSGVNEEDIISVNEKLEKIIFLDIAESTKTLEDLRANLILIGVIMLAVIFMISYYFAKRAIKPIKLSWEKQNQFIADASHEFKTPLAIINANTDVLLDNKDDKIVDQEKWIHYIQYEAGRMNHLVSDLLSLMKSNDEIATIARKPFELSKAVEITMASLEGIAYEKKIIFEQEIEQNIIIENDESRLKQVLLVLFDNAIKYAPEGSVVRVKLFASQKNVVFEIENDLYKVIEIEVERLFDRFYRVDDAREHHAGGYGLGLSIAKSMMSQLNGDILVEATKNDIKFIVKV